jgi:drug/metabolite transporter (DMT)-like permease
VAALLLATLFWGCAFTWAKSAGAAVNSEMGLPPGALLGPIWILGARFTIAGVVWLAIFPDSRRSWTWSALWRTLVLGGCLATGMIIQHLGLDRTSEAVSAFLTSLTILFVPVIMTIVLKRSPSPAVWLGVVLATAGVWLMTGASPTGFGIGELLGICCAITYSIDIIAINALVTQKDVSRLTAGQFLTVGLISMATCLFLPGGRASLAPSQLMALLSFKQIGINVALLTIFPSICAFGLQFTFQPRIDPTRAALIYLVEPIFAALYAMIASGRRLSSIALAGAGLILMANLLAEALQNRFRAPLPAPAQKPQFGTAVID